MTTSSHFPARLLVALFALVLLLGGSISVYGGINPSFAASFNDALNDPFSTWYGFLIWFSTLAFSLFASIVAFTLYKRTAPGTASRRVRLLLAVGQSIALAGAVAAFILSLLRHNYAAAAAFGALGAMMFIALKYGGIVLGILTVWFLKGAGEAAGKEVGADIYHRVKATLLKPKASTHPPDA